MYINITDTREAKNKGSSGGLVNYLEKENRLENEKEPELWFNQERQDLEAYVVRRALDGNTAKLGGGEAKFFLVNISPSQKELQHLKEQFGKNDLKAALKQYSEKVMDKYAKNFKRPGINSSKDLLWFAKVENHRYYNHKDKEVQNGTKKRGEKKEGNQIHVQVIVSRKDITNKIKLSPMNSSKGRNTEHSKKMGQFDRMAFKQCGESLFDELFDFERNLKDTLAYANIQKNGSLAQRQQLDMLEQGASQNYQSKSVAAELAIGVAEGLFQTTAGMLETVDKTAADFLEILMEPLYDSGMSSNPIEEEEKRRRKRKSQQQSQQMRR
jgi:hypothetical protein